MRVVRTPAGHIDVDAPPKAPGRGAYLCRTRECLSEAADGKALSRALATPFCEAAADRLRELVRQARVAEKDVSR
jgi:predicted RNA-binding protein YlxR (DUF448 family)